MPENGQPGTDAAPVVSAQTLQLFAQMAAGIPEADDSEAYESIVMQLLVADSVDALNAPWDTDAVDKIAGHQVRIDELTRRASDFAGGLGMYLVCKGVDQGTGERVILTTGAVSVVAQLARAYFLGGLPIVAQWIVGDPSPKTGRRPQHLTIVALSNTPASAATQTVHDTADGSEPAPF